MTNMTIDNLKTIVPSVFATAPAPKMSEKYTFVPTLELLESFDREGWKVSSAKQMGKGLYASHQLRLRNGAMPNVGDTLIEAIISNSHNGLLKLSVSAGLHRLVCSNGLTVPTAVSSKISVKHMRVDLGSVRQITDEFAIRLPMIEKSVKRLSETILTEDQAVSMATKAVSLRWESGNLPVGMTISQLLEPARKEDEGMSAWQIFNTLQEKLVRGGLRYSTEKGRRNTMKELKNFQKVNTINTELWELAESYC